jgi:hypothetical protein
MIGVPITKNALDVAVQADAAYLSNVMKVAIQRHEQYLQGMPTTLLGLNAIDTAYTQQDLDNITAIGYQWDRLQQLLTGTVPTSASDVLTDAAKVLDPSRAYP